MNKKTIAKLLSFFLFLSIASSSALACNGEDLCDNADCEQRSVLKKRARPENPFLNQVEANKRFKPRPSLLEAATTGDISEVQTYVRDGEIFSLDSLGRNAYHLAASYGQLKVVKLLSQTQLAFFVDSNGDTPLHSAIAADHILVAQLIAQANPLMAEVRNHQGLTPFLSAAKHPSVEDFWLAEDNESLKLLQQLATIPNVWALDDQGRTALSLAWDSKRRDALQTLFQLTPGVPIPSFQPDLTLNERLSVLSNKVGIRNEKGLHKVIVDEIEFLLKLTVTQSSFTMEIFGETGEKCITLIGSTRDVELDSLKGGNQCPFSGTEGLRIAETISRALGAPSMMLQDASALRHHNGKSINQSLKWLHLFQKGTTWYESKGFKPGIEVGADEFYEEYRGWVDTVRNVDITQAYLENYRYRVDTAQRMTIAEIHRLETYIRNFRETSFDHDHRLYRFVEWMWNNHFEETQKVINDILLLGLKLDHSNTPQFIRAAAQIHGVVYFTKDLSGEDSSAE